ncbi:hypothetical protein STFE110948_06845 [Streptobacillus felis]|uniref:hypothetical protein n=1 Tax=Streptobacillus felis TaxID=1384509 RepID=UPI0008337B1C|nr:hypothetical protein [Streptobacillus felis]
MKKYILMIIFIFILLKIVSTFNLTDVGYYTDDIMFIKNEKKIIFLKNNEKLINVKSVYRFPGYINALMIKTNSREYIYYFNSDYILHDLEKDYFDYPLSKDSIENNLYIDFDLFFILFTVESKYE